MASESSPYLDLSVLERVVTGATEPGDGQALLDALQRVCDEGAEEIRSPNDGGILAMCAMRATSTAIDVARLQASVRAQQIARQQAHLFATVTP